MRLQANSQRKTTHFGIYIKTLSRDKSQAVDSISVTVCIDIVFQQLERFFCPKKLLSKKLGCQSFTDVQFVVYYKGTPLGGMILTREEKLMIRIGQGDMDAVDELIGLLYPEILRYCLWHAPNPGLAEDAAQETFLKAIRYYDRYVHKGKCKAFLYRIAANTCVDMYRKMDIGELSIEDIPAELPSEESGFERIHADLNFHQQIRSLPPEQQEILLLRFGQELTLRQIAQVTGVPLRTVQSRLRAALKKLKSQLEKEEHCDK